MYSIYYVKNFGVNIVKRSMFLNRVKLVREKNYFKMNKI